MAFIDITGNVYNQLTVLYVALPKSNPTKWVCRCSCGTVKTIAGASMKNGSTKSCGCLHISTNKKQFTKHGDYLNKLYLVHRSMIQRCQNPNHKSFKDYGGRGITICNEWSDFMSFKEWSNANGYKDGLSIERIDTNKGYSPSNCCWTNPTQQARNRRAMKGYSSKYIGVAWDNSRSKWFVSIGINRKTIPLGRFTSEIEAAIARDNYIIENNLEGFTLNFP